MKKTYIKPIMTEETIHVGEMICDPIIGSSNSNTSSLPGGTKGDSRRLRFEEDDEFDEISLDEFFRSWE